MADDRVDDWARDHDDAEGGKADVSRNDALARSERFQFLLVYRGELGGFSQCPARTRKSLVRSQLSSMF